MANITIHGRFVRDPELSHVTVKGEDRALCKFTVAEDKRFGEEASFFDCQIWGKRAETIQKFFSRGKDIVLYGRFEQEPYEDKEGKTRRPWKLTVENFDFCGSKKDGESASRSDSDVPDGFTQIDEEDMPF